MVTAWFYNTQDTSDPRSPHKYTPNQPISNEYLAKVGVLDWHFNPETELEKVYELMKQRNYSSSDQVLNSLWGGYLESESGGGSIYYI